MSVRNPARGLGQAPSSSLPKTPYSNGRSPAPGANDRAGARRMGGSQRVGAIPVKPAAMPPHDVPDIGGLADRVGKNSESGRR